MYSHRFVPRLIVAWSCCLLVLSSTSASATHAVPDQEQATPHGIWQCWDDGSPDSCHEALFSISMLSATDSWATGVQRLLHWNGDTWTAVPNPTASPLFGVAMVSSNDAWAVGGPGTILHWNGQAWAEVSSPTTIPLLAVAMLSDDDGWAVGGDSLAGSSVLLHWDGAAWSEVLNRWLGRRRRRDHLALRSIASRDLLACGCEVARQYEPRAESGDRRAERNPQPPAHDKSGRLAATTLNGAIT